MMQDNKIWYMQGDKVCVKAVLVFNYTCISNDRSSYMPQKNLPCIIKVVKFC